MLRFLLATLLLAVGAGCETDSYPAQAGSANSAPPNSATASWLPEDLEGMWRGWSFPTGTAGFPVQLTLGFESLGEEPEDLALTHYSFPAAGGWSTINYLANMQEYTLRFEPDGSMQLDTYIVIVDGYGNLIEERIWKDLQMAPDGETMAGFENILLTTWNGGYSVQHHLSFWLTLDRLD